MPQLAETYWSIHYNSITQSSKVRQEWEILSWCGVTPLKAVVYWTEVVQQTSEVHDPWVIVEMGERVGVEGAALWEIGTIQISRHQNFYSWDIRCSLTHCYVAVVTTLCRHRKFRPNTKSTCTDIQRDYNRIKQELSFGHRRNAVFSNSDTQFWCSTNMNTNVKHANIYEARPSHPLQKKSSPMLSCAAPNPRNIVRFPFPLSSYQEGNSSLTGGTRSNNQKRKKLIFSFASSLPTHVLLFTLLPKLP